MPPRKKVVEEVVADKGINLRYVLNEQSKAIHDVQERIAELEKVFTSQMNVFGRALVALDNMVGDLQELKEKVASLETKKAQYPSIHKTETFNGELPVEPNESNGLRMNHGDRIQSMRNAIAILNPKLIIEGRHLRENVQAVCGFMIDEEMMDEAYALIEANQ